MIEEEEKRDLSIYSEGLREAIEAIPPHINEMSEDQLRKKIDPTIKDYELKRAFWAEMVGKKAKSGKMMVSKIYRGIYTKESFYRIIKDANRMAWLIHPLTTYENRTQAALDKVTERYDELISMDINSHRKIKDENGDDKWIVETDPKKALVLLQVIKNLEDRIKGTSIQRQVSVHTDRPTGSDGNTTGTVNMNTVNERLKELEHQLGDKGGFTEGEDVVSGHKVSSHGESGDTDGDSCEQGDASSDERMGEVVSSKTIDIESTDYREIDK